MAAVPSGLVVGCPEDPSPQPSPPGEGLRRVCCAGRVGGLRRGCLGRQPPSPQPSPSRARVKEATQSGSSSGPRARVLGLAATLIPAVSLKGVLCVIRAWLPGRPSPRPSPRGDLCVTRAWLPGRPSPRPSPRGRGRKSGPACKVEAGFCKGLSRATEKERRWSGGEHSGCWRVGWDALPGRPLS